MSSGCTRRSTYSPKKSRRKTKMNRIPLLLVLALCTWAVSTCKQQKAEETITQYCLDRPDEFPGYEPVSFDEISETYSNPNYVPSAPEASGEAVLQTPPISPDELKHDGWMTHHRFKAQNPDGALELYDKVFCLDLGLTRVTRVSDRW